MVSALGQGSVVIQPPCCYPENINIFRTIDEARRWADELIRENNFPPYSDLQLDECGKIIIVWDYSYDLEKALTKMYPDLCEPKYIDTVFTNFTLEIEPKGQPKCYTHMTRWYTYDDWDRYNKELDPKVIFPIGISYPNQKASV